ncbi:MAG: tryptophan 2,3-dioxygenase family protein [Bdellovibrionales bacterium]
MTALEFLEFRNYLYPASGFQSAQFRLLENKLGLDKSQRKIHGGCPYHAFLKEDEKPAVLASEEEPSVLKSVGAWLERTPYLKTEGYDFWTEYKSSVETMLLEEEGLIKNNSNLSDNEKEKSLESVSTTKSSFKEFMDKDKFENGAWSLSFEALQAALFIQLYRHDLKLQSANRLIEQLIDLDENMTQWRNRHAQMALRMLGHKVGTGGSSGEEYLRSAAKNHKVFTDFFKLTTFFIDGRKLKRLPES